MQALEYLKSMLVFDAVIYNEDRHYSNFGVLMDSRNCNIFAAAPIFDNGVSLFNYTMQDDIDNLYEYAKTRINPYDIPYEVICCEVLGKMQRKQLKKILGFKFSKHHSYNLPEKRLNVIEKQIRQDSFNIHTSLLPSSYISLDIGRMNNMVTASRPDNITMGR